MQKNPGHQPERFEVYTQLQNGLGFKLKDNDHIFYYDRHGGWKDEYGNYYNSDAQPDQQPDQQSDKSISQGDWQSSEDQFEKQFGPSNDVKQEFQKQPVQSQVQQAIAKNIAQLERHIVNQPLRVNFQILDFQGDEQLPTIKDLIISYKKKVKGIISAFYDDDVEGEDQPNTGYFIVSNVHQATKLINLQGENIVGNDVSFTVETFQQLRNDPISEKELQKPIPQFVGVSGQQKLYTLEYQNGEGFSCDKKTFNDWIKKLQLKNNEIVKMRKNEKKQKIPIVKLNQKQVSRISQLPLQGKKVFVKVYESKKHHHQQEEQKQIEKKQKQNNNTEPKQQQAEKSTQETTTEQPKTQ